MKKQGKKQRRIRTQLWKVINIEHSVEWIFSLQYSNNCWFPFALSVSSFNNCKKFIFFKNSAIACVVLTYFSGSILIKVKYGSDVQIIDG